MQATVLITCVVASCMFSGSAAQQRTFPYERKPTMFDALANMASNGGFGASVGVTRNGASGSNGVLASNVRPTANVGIASNVGSNGNVGLANTLRLASNGGAAGNGGVLQSLFNQPAESKLLF